MIQTKEAFFYEDRGDKFGKIQIEISGYSSNTDGIYYQVTDLAIFNDGTKIIYNQKNVFYSNEQIDALDVYIESNHDLTAFSKSEKEWEKVKIALMLDTQTNLLPTGLTIYRLTPADWEFTPEPIEPQVII
jgi:hypothetical protein